MFDCFLNVPLKFLSKLVLPGQSLSLLWKTLPVAAITIEQFSGKNFKAWTSPKKGKSIKPVQSPSKVPLIGGSVPDIWCDPWKIFAW